MVRGRQEASARHTSIGRSGREADTHVQVFSLILTHNSPDDVDTVATPKGTEPLLLVDAREAVANASVASDLATPDGRVGICKGDTRMWSVALPDKPHPHLELDLP